MMLGECLRPSMEQEELMVCWLLALFISITPKGEFSHLCAKTYTQGNRTAPLPHGSGVEPKRELNNRFTFTIATNVDVALWNLSFKFTWSAFLGALPRTECWASKYERNRDGLAFGVIKEIWGSLMKEIRFRHTLLSCWVIVLLEWGYWQPNPGHVGHFRPWENTPKR